MSLPPRVKLKIGRAASISSASLSFPVRSTGAQTVQAEQVQSLFALGEFVAVEAKLVVVGGEAKTGEIKLKLPAVVGRSHDADVRLSHLLVSRRHCEISERDGLLHIKDLGSLNGTYIADNRVEEATLHPDELITIGPVTFRAVYKTGSPQASPSPESVAAMIGGKKTVRFDETVSPEDLPDGGVETEMFDLTPDSDESDDELKMEGDSLKMDDDSLDFALEGSPAAEEEAAEEFVVDEPVEEPIAKDEPAVEEIAVEDFSIAEDSADDDFALKTDADQPDEFSIDSIDDSADDVSEFSFDAATDDDDDDDERGEGDSIDFTLDSDESGEESAKKGAKKGAGKGDDDDDELNDFFKNLGID
jgi:hypothetical protein